MTRPSSLVIDTTVHGTDVVCARNGTDVRIAARKRSTSLSLSRFLRLKHIFLWAFYFAIALNSSIIVEDISRRFVMSRKSAVPEVTEYIINFFGTGKTHSPHNLAIEETSGGIISKPAVQDFRNLTVSQKVPVVFFASHVPNEVNHPAMRVIRQARKTNSLVYLLGPRRLPHLSKLGVIIQPKEAYRRTIEAVEKKFGECDIEVFKYWILQEFMQRHAFRRVFLLSVNVMLYTNITEWAAWLLPESHIALPVRWPSLQLPTLPSQYVSTTVSGHVGLWSKEGLGDFLKLWKVVLDVALFGGGKPGSKKLIGQVNYKQQNILGWYSYSKCWLEPNLEPPCLAEETVGITPTRAAKIRSKFRPKFEVDSLCKPLWCPNSTWSNFGLCTFDNVFSVMTPSRQFRFMKGDKCPSSKLYEYYGAWTGGATKQSVQFLAVNFQGKKRDYLLMEDDDPSKSWGSSRFL